METRINKAQKFYSNNGINRVDTIIIKTLNGNYIYEHILNGNSHQGSRIYNPTTGEDELLHNYNYLYYAKSVYNLTARLIDEFVIGKDVEQKYNENKSLKLLPLVSVFENII